MREHETVTKGTERYRNLTKTKAIEKEKKRAAAGVWAGWGRDRPVMRLGGAAAVQAASPCAAAHGAQARRWLGRTRASPGQVKGREVPRRPAAPLGQAGASTPSKGKVVHRRPALTTMISEPALVVKTKLQDDSSADDLRKWAVAVAFGKPVLVDGGRGPVDRLRYKPALGQVHGMQFTEKFSSRYPELEKITSAMAEGNGSKWRVWPRGSPELPGRDALEIDSAASFSRVLRSMMGWG